MYKNLYMHWETKKSMWISLLFCLLYCRNLEVNLQNLSEYACIPGGSDCKESSCNAGDLGLIPGLGWSPTEGNCNTLQYSCLENSMDRGARWATVHGVRRIRHNRNSLSLHFSCLYIFWIYISYWIYNWQLFSLILSYLFAFLIECFEE